MKKVYLIHGYGGEPNGGWRPWLMGKLAKKDIWACALAMPMSDEPKKDEWIAEMKRVIGKPNEDIFLVGHSLGVSAILNYLQSLDSEVVGGAILVSGPIHVLGDDKYRAIDHFMNKDFNFEYIKNVCKNFCVIHGDNDVTVPFSHAVELSNNLNCQLITIKNGGHLNGSSGWYELPEAYETILKML